MQIPPVLDEVTEQEPVTLPAAPSTPNRTFVVPVIITFPFVSKTWTATATLPPPPPLFAVASNQMRLLARLHRIEAAGPPIEVIRELAETGPTANVTVPVEPMGLPS